MTVRQVGRQAGRQTSNRSKVMRMIRTGAIARNTYRSTLKHDPKQSLSS